MSKRKKIIIAIIGVVIVGIMVAVNLRRGAGNEVEVRAEPVGVSDIIQTVSGSGKVQPVTEVKISANVSAEITRLHVEEGDRVKKGQVLVELDRTRYVAALNRAQSSLKSAEANLIKTRSEYQRAQELHARGLYSEAELEAAKAALTLAESEVEQARAGLAQSQDDLSKTTLRSPIEGTVTIINKEEGEIALGSQFTSDVILTVADLSQMEMTAKIDENDVVLIETGDLATLEVDALPDTLLPCVVAEIAHAATTTGMGTQEEITNFDVTVRLQTIHHKLRPGMSATVDIQTEVKRNVANIPIQCVTVRPKSALTDTTMAYRESRASRQNRNDNSRIEEVSSNDRGERNSGATQEESIEVAFVVEDEQAAMRPVITGISDDTHIEVLSGLKEGDMVITGPYKVLSRTLRDGQKVKIEQPDKKKRRWEAEES